MRLVKGLSSRERLRDLLFLLTLSFRKERVANL
jgi:hypothetical protein